MNTYLENSIDTMRLELSVKAKNGINFILSAVVVWSGITVIWLLDLSPKTKAFATFMASVPLIPMAFGLSKVMNIAWKIENNPLEPLGLWLNFAQLLYFPFVILAFMKAPHTMPMALGIVTGAHFFPYAWFYRSLSYAVMASVSVVVITVVGVRVLPEETYQVPLAVTLLLAVLFCLLLVDYRRNKQLYEKKSVK